MLAITIAITLLIAGLLFAAGVIIFIRKQKSLDEENNPTLINFNTRYTKKYGYGVQTDVSEGKNGRRIYNMKRRDVSPKNLEKQDQEEKIIVVKGRDPVIPKGIMSTDKDIRFLLPPKADDLPDGFKDTVLGKYFSFFTELGNMDNATIDALKEANSRAMKHMREHAGGEVSGEQMENLETYYKSVLDAVKNAQKDQFKHQGYPQSR